MSYKLQTLPQYLVAKDACLPIFGSGKHGDRLLQFIETINDIYRSPII